MALRSARWLVASVITAAVAASALGACRFFDVAPPRADAGVGEASGAEVGPSLDAGALQPGLLSLSDAVRACSRIVGCTDLLARSVQLSFGISVDPTNFAHCVDALAGPLDPERLNEGVRQQLTCVAAASSCEEATACLWRQWQSPRDPRCDSLASGSTCIDDGGTALFCDNALVSDTVICGSNAYGPGSRCTEVAGRPVCTNTAACVPLSAQCLGTVADACNDAGVHAQIDCALAGHRCVSSATGFGCDAPSCSDIALTTCVGTRMSVCSGFAVTLVDCAHVGGTCQKSNTTVACARSNDECSVFDDPRVERCSDATTLQLCFAGRKTALSCASIDGMRCVSAKDGKSSFCAR